MDYRDYIKDLEDNRKFQDTIGRDKNEGKWESVTVYTDQGPITRTVFGFGWCIIGTCAIISW